MSAASSPSRWRRLWNRETSPIPHLTWVVPMAFGAAPWEFGLYLIASLAIGITPAATLVMMRNLTDLVAVGAPGGSLAGPLLTLALLLVLTGAAGAVITPMVTRAQHKLQMRLQERIHEKAASLSLAQYDQPGVHDLIARASAGQGERVGEQIIHLVGLVRTALQTLSSLWVILAVSPLIALLAVLAAVPIGWAGMRQGKAMFALWRANAPHRRMYQYLERLLSDRRSATEVRAYQLGSYLVGRWREAIGQQWAQNLRLRRESARQGWYADMAATVLFIVSLAILAEMGQSGAVGAGQFVALTGAIPLLRGSATGLADSISSYWESGLPLIEVDSFLRLPGEERPAGQGLPFPRPVSQGIRLEGVSYTYPGAEKPSLCDINLTIRPGEKLAVVGVNGAGKTTLIKLVLGLYQPTAGRITVDGVDLQATEIADLRRNVSAAFQDFARFDMTLRENVAAGRVGATRAEVAQACAQAGISDMVEGLPQGADTLLGKSFSGGVDLSGGQWQRVALARTLVRDAQVLVLDEPTAALDARAELDLFERFVELAQGRIALLISHRLGIARQADRIIVLSDGRIVEEGDHASLLAADGAYAQLFRAQAQWYEEVE